MRVKGRGVRCFLRDLDVAGEPMDEDDVGRPLSVCHVRDRDVTAACVAELVKRAHDASLGPGGAGRKTGVDASLRLRQRSEMRRTSDEDNGKAAGTI